MTLWLFPFLFLITLFTEPGFAYDWLSYISTPEIFNEITVKDNSRADLVRVGKYTTPALDDAPLQETVFQNTNIYPLHLEFLKHTFPLYFSNWTAQNYKTAILDSTRQYFAGAIFQFKSKKGETIYGFDLSGSAGNPVTLEQVKRVYAILLGRTYIRPFVYSPFSITEINRALAWNSQDIPIYTPNGLIPSSIPLKIVIPAGAKAGSTFQDFVHVESIYRNKTLVSFIPGEYPLPTKPGKYEMNLIELLEYTPEKRKFVPAGSGTMSVEYFDQYFKYNQYTYSQTLKNGTDEFTIKIEGINFIITNGQFETDTLLYDESYLVRIPMFGDYQKQMIRFSSATHKTMDLFRSDYTLENGQSIRIYQRGSSIRAGSTPSRPVYVQVHINEGDTEQRNFWNLDYSCTWHNLDEEYIVMFDAPLGDAYGVVIRDNVVSEENGDPPGYNARQIFTLDKNLNQIRRIAVTGYQTGLSTDIIPPIHTPVVEWGLY